MSMDNRVLGSKARHYPGRQSKNLDKREREYLLPSELNSLLIAAKKARNGHRVYTLVLLGFRHGLRVGEIVDLTWNDIDLLQERIQIRRLKHGIQQSHPLARDEVKALKTLLANKEKIHKHVFISQKGTIYTERGVYYLINKLGIAAKISFPVHPHMLRHTCAYMLASKTGDALLVKDYLGQKDIKSAIHYLNLSGDRFNNIGAWWN